MRRLSNSPQLSAVSPVDPRLFLTLTGMAYVHFFAGRYDESLSWATRATQRQPNFPGSQRMVMASLAMVGRVAEAHRACDALLQADPASVHFRHQKQNPIPSTRRHRAIGAGHRIAGVPESSHEATELPVEADSPTLHITGGQHGIYRHEHRFRGPRGQEPALGRRLHGSLGGGFVMLTLIAMPARAASRASPERSPPARRFPNMLPSLFAPVKPSSPPARSFGVASGYCARSGGVRARRQAPSGIDPGYPECQERFTPAHHTAC